MGARLNAEDLPPVQHHFERETLRKLGMGKPLPHPRGKTFRARMQSIRRGTMTKSSDRPDTAQYTYSV